jgi:hypothetical protein
MCGKLTAVVGLSLEPHQPLSPWPPRLLQFRRQPRPIGVKLGMAISHGPQFIEHHGHVPHHADLIRLGIWLTAYTYAAFRYARILPKQYAAKAQRRERAGMAELIRMKLAEAARHAGVSVDTIRRAIRRKTVDAQRDNSGAWFVLMPTDADAAALALRRRSAAYAEPEPMQNNPQASAEHTQHSAYAAHAELVTELRSQIAILRSDLERERSERNAERERLLKLVETAVQSGRETWLERLVRLVRRV